MSRRKWTKRHHVPMPGTTKVVNEMKKQHLIDNPWCKYGMEPHFVPPCFGDPGFFACEVDRPAQKE